MKCLVVFGPKANVLSNLYTHKTFKNWKLVIIGRDLKVIYNSMKQQNNFSEIIQIEVDYLKLKIIEDYQKIANDLAQHLSHEPERNFFLFAQGAIQRLPFFFQTDEQLLNQFKINLEFPVRCTHAILKTNPNLLSSNWYYLSSIATQRCDVGVSLYASTKSALEKFCETLRLEQKLTSKVLRIILIDGWLSKGLPDDVKNELQRLAFNSKFNSKSAFVEYLVLDFSNPDTEICIVE